MRTSTTTSKTSKKLSVPRKAPSFTSALDCFQRKTDGYEQAIRTVIDVAWRMNVKEQETLRSMARSLYASAMKSKKEELKGFACLARRLSDRLPRCLSDHHSIDESELPCPDV
jgi:hypothetical protein